MNEFIVFTVVGLGIGAAYSLLALSLVVTYQGSGIINFATGAQALLAAAVFYELSNSVGRSTAAVIAVAVSAVVGALIQLCVMRPLRNASPLVRVIATLAILGMLEVAAFKRYGDFPPRVTGVVPTDSVRVFGALVGQDRLWNLLIAVVLFIGCYVIYRFTRVGLATNAVAENELATATLGWSPDRVATLNWGVGGALAGVAGILLVPVASLVSTGMTLMIVPALAAALIGGFRSFPLTLLGALLTGFLESQTTAHVETPGWPSAVPFILIIAILVFRGQSLPLRSHVAERLPRIGSGHINLPVVAIFLGLAFWVSLLSADWATAVATTAIFALICLSLVVVTGYAGQLSLVQMGFAGLGALIASRLGDAAGLPFIVCFIAATLAGMAVGALFGLPAVRVRGANLAVVTLGLGVVVNNVILGNPDFTGGAIRGTVLPETRLFGWNISAVAHPQRYAWVVLLMLLLAVIPVANLRKSATGRRLIAVRDNERAAASLGINVAVAKLYAFSVSAALASAAGVLFAFRQTYVSFSNYDVLSSVNAVVVSVLGGIGSLLGAMFGGFVAPNGVSQNFFNQWWSASGYFPLITAALLIPTVIANPNGIADEVMKQVNWVRRQFHRVTGGRLVRAAAAQAWTDQARVQPSRVTGKTLEVTDVSVAFGGNRVLHNLSLTVGPGEVVGLIGPNGAGKTTLIDAVTGYVPAATGSVHLGSTPITELSVVQRSRLGLSRSFQSLELFEDLTVLENVCVGTGGGGRWRGVVDLIRPGKLTPTQSARAALEEFHLVDVLDKRPDELSYAQRRLVAIARSVAREPAVLLLDEPAAGLDERSTRELSHLIRRLAAEWGMGILLIEHDVPMVFATCDRVVAIDFGKKVAEGSPDEVRQDSAVLSSYLGDTAAVNSPGQKTAPSEHSLSEKGVASAGAAHSTRH